MAHLRSWSLPKIWNWFMQFSLHIARSGKILWICVNTRWEQHRKTKTWTLYKKKLFWDARRRKTVFLMRKGSQTTIFSLSVCFLVDFGGLSVPLGHMGIKRITRDYIRRASADKTRTCLNFKSKIHIWTKIF